MFNKDLFLSLCKKYNVELSETANSPMIKDKLQTRAITIDDINHIYKPRQAYFEYSINKINAKVEEATYYLQDDYAIAC